MTRRRWRVLAVLTAAAALAVAGCGGGDGGSGALTADSIREKGKLVVGTKFDQPLFGQRNPTNGAIEGFDVEIAKIIARAIFGDDIEGKVEFTETPSTVREAVITDGKVDIVVATYTINDTRKEQVDFAGPYYTAGQDIMVRSDETGIAGVADLNGKKVCSVQGSTSIKNVAEQAPQADLSISFDKYSLCAEALGDGRVDAVTTDNTILVGYVGRSNGAYKLVGNPFTTEPYGIGLKKGSDDLRAFINDTLEAAYADGSWKRAFEATVGLGGLETPEPPPVDRY
jgi:glutamate transport system substrate-binding protein